jgi:hypothetical protein
MRRATSGSVAGALAGILLAAAVAAGGAGGGDPDLARGVAEVRAGAFGPAIETLGDVVRRVGSDPARAEEAAQAFLHLGIAYAALGEASPARSQFIQALKRNPGLAPDPGYPPKVLDAFAAARREARAAGLLPEPKKKSGMWKVAVGVGAAGVAAVAVAAGGDTSTPQAPPTPLAGPLPDHFVLTSAQGSGVVRLVDSAPASGSRLSLGSPALHFTFEIHNDGTLTTFPRVQIAVQLRDAGDNPCLVGASDPISFLPGDAGVYVVDRFRAVCSAPFTTTTAFVTLIDPRFGRSAYSASYQGGYVVVP